MIIRRYNPRRRLRSEMLSLVSVVCVSFAVVSLFPRGDGLFFGRERRSSERLAPDRAACAFVTLTPAQEDAALAAARTSWQADSHSAHRRIEMLPAELPQIGFSPAVDLGARPATPVVFRARPRVRLLPPTVAAPRLPRLRPTADVAPLPFPRESMLKLLD